MIFQIFALYFKQTGNIIQLECHQQAFDVTEWKWKHFPSCDATCLNNAVTNIKTNSSK